MNDKYFDADVVEHAVWYARSRGVTDEMLDAIRSGARAESALEAMARYESVDRSLAKLEHWRDHWQRVGNVAKDNCINDMDAVLDEHERQHAMMANRRQDNEWPNTKGLAEYWGRDEDESYAIDDCTPDKPCDAEYTCEACQESGATPFDPADLARRISGGARIIRITIQHVHEGTHNTYVKDAGFTIDTVVPDDWDDEQVLDNMSELNKDIVRMEGVS